jgi:ankyrin repeat protein
VPRGRPEIRSAIEAALEQHKDEVHRILVDYGVPLIRCDTCLVSGDLPSHGPYKPEDTAPPTKAELDAERRHRMADLKRWLAQGARPDDELADAIVANDVDRVSYLLAHGAHTDVRDGDGYTPLINATRFSFLPLATYLADHKADVNLGDRNNWTPLMYAAWQDNPDLVAMLTKHGARIDVVSADGLTPLAIAAQNGKFKSAEALVAAGADVNAPVAKGGYTPLMLAAISGSTDLTSALISHGAKVNATNPGGLTPLMIAAANNHPRVAELLLKSGADPAARSEDGRTALSIAQANNDDGMVQLLQNAAQKAVASATG